MTSSNAEIKGADSTIPLIVEECSGFDRQNEPVTVGVPFPRGAVKELSELLLLDPQGHEIPLQSQVLDRWPDQGLKWVLFDFQATVAANTSTQYAIHVDKFRESSRTPRVLGVPEQPHRIVLKETSNTVTVSTGTANFVVDGTIFKPFKQVVVHDVSIIDASKSCMILLDEGGQEYEHSIQNIIIETEGALRTTLKIDGNIVSKNKEILAEFFARIHFYAGSSVSKVEYTIRNPKVAQHLGGLWDLGDENSIYFDDLSIQLAMSSNEATTIAWTTQPENPLNKSETGKIKIYQDSSGGENWKSSNHVNRFGKVMHSFRGYRVKAEKLIEEGNRASPIVAIQDNKKKITAAIQRFWENFPKAIEANNNILTVRLFPTQYRDVFELQGGEQKTHTIFLSFEVPDPAKISEPSQSSLNWIQQPLVPHTSPEWYAQSKAFNYIIPYTEDRHLEVILLISSAIDGDNSFVKRREMIDEYGWRNFGELYADHETVYYKGDGLPISHYNNQYDCIYAHIIQYVRSGNIKWFIPMNDLAHHVIDIDIYHTDQDKSAYNRGLFWHTFHYLDAATATHRAYSKKTMEIEGFDVYGGGHSNEHNYATGLMYHYYLTGELASKEAAIGLADWVVNMDDGAKTKFRFLNKRPTGAASASGELEYHGPGRGGGYSINTLLDAYMLTKDQHYLAKAEQLIQRCIHPQDDIAERDLLNLEPRWSYTVFLQVIGRYLDLKVELDELDYLYCYARESLMHYAKWMCNHERCSSTDFANVNYPTETWPAQDLRKSSVLLFAAKYSQGKQRTEFLEKAKFFFEKPLEDLFSFETRTLTRPLIILMTNSSMPSYFQQYPDETGSIVECPHDFGKPQQFKPQLYYVYKLRTTLSNFMSIIRKVLGKEWKEPIK